MHKRLAKQLEKARLPTGEVDMEALAHLVSQAYDEAEQDRERTDRSISLMVDELSAFQRQLQDTIDSRTAALRSSKAKLKARNGHFSAALDNMEHGLALFDGRSRLVTCNRRFLEMYGLPKALGRRGTPFASVLRGCIASNAFVGDDPDTYFASTMALITRNTSYDRVTTLNTGRVIAVGVRRVADGGWVSTHRDATQFHMMQEELQHLAYHDALTGLPNRTLLRQRLAEAQAGAGGDFALLCLDLDGFKPINDELGHAAGDTILRTFAKCLSLSIGPLDTAARMGGDEFVIVHANATYDSAMALARKVQLGMSLPIEIDGRSVPTSVSIGMAFASAGSDADAILRRADVALYASKRSGRGGIRRFEHAMDNAALERQQLELDLRRAVQRGEFELAYQPIVSLTSQALTGFEALLRWRHPERGLISPAAFIPLAESTGLIVPIGEWVIREAVAEAARWPGKVRVAVNVSSMQFARGGLVTTVAQALATSGLPHDRLEVEITESVFLDNSDLNLSVLRQLHQLGVKIALDDFGTGYSALGYLLAFPFDKIKLDGQFVRALDATPGAHVIMQAVSEVGKRMGMTTTAEGIETPQQLRNVHALGYSEAQGYLIAKPMPAENVRKMLLDAYDAMPDLPYREAVAG